ncbi:MAG TPA: RNA polymerase sigma factor [Polyangiaceae bacterium]|nr:RNA polymerase sigma factor [Polyangiaceae bacterium]
MSQSLRAVPRPQDEAALPAAAPASLETAYVDWAGYVWRMLQRLGVRQADLEDLCHDVFLIAHRRFGDFDGRVAMNAWLFGICLRVAANYRRRARFRLEHRSTGLEDEGAGLRAPPSTEPDQQLARRQAQARAQAILDGMDPTKRAVFMMYEVEGLSCQAIASELGVPVGTIYSRLHAARGLFEAEAERLASAQRKEAP